MAINQITMIQMPDGTPVAITDWSARPIFSTCDLLTGMTDENVRIFTYGESDNVTQSANFVAAAARQATLRDTNIAVSNEMDSTEEYLCYEVKAEVHELHFNANTNLFDFGEVGFPVPRAPFVSELQRRLVLELEVSEKAFPQAGLGWFLTGFGLFGFGVGTPADNAIRTYGNNGQPGHHAAYSMPIPVHMGGTEDYAVILHNPGGGVFNFPGDAGAAGGEAATIAQIRVYLCGLHKRPMG